MTQARYCFDTSSLLTSWLYNYQILNFPKFWEDLSGLFANGEAVIAEEIYYEFERKSDDLFSWVKANVSTIVPPSLPIQDKVRKILSQYPRLIDTRKNRSGGDPFLIATASIENYTVVTQELASDNQDKPKIPTVCDALKIRWMPISGVISEQGWRY